MPRSQSTDRRRLFRWRPVSDWLVAAWVVLILGVWFYTRVDPQTGAEDHEHPPGTHGGVIASFAHDRYHAEALLEEGGTLRIFMLGRDETEVVDVPRQSPVAYVRFGERQAKAVELEPLPQPGDRPERTSQFVGQIPPEEEGEPLSLTVSPLQIGGSRYRLAFAWEDQQQEHAMPQKVEEDAERQLYLVAGGGYTQSDIEANGRVTASEKFAGFQSRHDFTPQPGDRLCPISRTKASAECTWIIGGREYQFCCPPCIDEFVRLAKEQPDQIQAPETYVK